MAKRSLQFKHTTLDISYEIINPDAKYDIVFLHGWGSNKALMKQSFGATLKPFRHIYIDLMGFGNSTCNIALNSEDYATVLEQFLAQIEVSKNIIVGHSFGGKVATLLNPELLVLLSSAGIVLSKPFSVQFKIALFKFLKGVGLDRLRGYFVAEDAKALNEAMYQTFKNVVDEDFESIFSRFSHRALICWGKDDRATPLRSGEKIATLITQSEFVVYEGDHYFFMQHSEAIASQIERAYIALNSH